MKYYRELLGVACLGFGLVASSAAFADSEVSTDGGVMIGKKTDDFWFSVGGGLRFDQIFFTGNAQSRGSQFRSGADIHRSWLDFDGGVGENITYSIDFSIGTDAKLKLGDAFATYKGFGKDFDVSVGQLSPGFSLQSTSSSKWTAFLERSLDASAFNVTSGLGANLTKWSNQYSVNISAIQPKKGETPHNAAGADLNRNDRWTVATRVTYNPFVCLDEHKVFQIGGSASYHDDSNAGITFRTFPEAHNRNTGYALTTDDASNLANPTKHIGARHHEIYAVEISGQNGPFYAESEYHIARVERSRGKGENLRFNGWHVQATYVLTGEARTYKARSGTFEQVIPNSERGAWEVAARYSTVKLNSKDIRGGVGKNATLGVNYYANKNIKVAANYIRSKQKKDTENRKLNIFGVRLQLVF
jgi:phosphate-selective porin OprO and OprP